MGVDVRWRQLKEMCLRLSNLQKNLDVSNSSNIKYRKYHLYFLSRKKSHQIFILLKHLVQLSL